MRIVVPSPQQVVVHQKPLIQQQVVVRRVQVVDDRVLDVIQLLNDVLHRVLLRLKRLRRLLVLVLLLLQPSQVLVVLLEDIRVLLGLFVHRLLDVLHLVVVLLQLAEHSRN